MKRKILNLQLSEEAQNMLMLHVFLDRYVYLQEGIILCCMQVFVSLVLTDLSPRFSW